MPRPGRRRRPGWRLLMLRRVVQVLERRPELAGVPPTRRPPGRAHHLVRVTHEISENPVTHHELKTTPAWFEPTWTGAKTFEVRFDDRAYQRGDTVLLREWDRRASCDCVEGHDETTCKKYSGRELSASVGHVLASTPSAGQQRGFWGNGYVVFSLCDPQHHDRRTAAPVAPSPLLLAQKKVTS